MLCDDPKTESARITGYPSCLAKESSDDSDPNRIIECMIPGCGYAGPDTRDVLYHISIDHPKDEIACKRCGEKTKLEGHKWCEDCINICEPAEMTDEEKSDAEKHRGKSFKAMEEEKNQAQQVEEQKKEDETMPKGYGVAKEKICVDCGGKYKPKANCQKRCGKCGKKPTMKPKTDKVEKTIAKVEKTFYNDLPQDESEDKVVYEAKPEVVEYSMIDGSRLRLSVVNGTVIGIVIAPPKDGE